ASFQHQAGARIALREAEPDRVVVDVDGGGGLLVVRRSFQDLWRAQAGAQRLPVVPVDVALTGVVVPPGRQRVVLAVSALPEQVASVVALLVATALLALALWPRERSTSGPHARVAAS